MIILLDIFQKRNKRKKLNKTRQKIKKHSEKVQPVSGGGKQNKKFSKNNKKIVKVFTASGFSILTK